MNLLLKSSYYIVFVPLQILYCGIFQHCRAICAHCYFSCRVIYTLNFNENIFCDESTEMGTRFAGKTINFSNCFSDGNVAMGKGYNNGTVPQLWNYTFGAVNKTSCFSGENNKHLTNYLYYVYGIGDVCEPTYTIPTLGDFVISELCLLKMNV